MQSRTKYRRAIRANDLQGHAGYRSIPLFPYILLVKHKGTSGRPFHRELEGPSKARVGVAMYRCDGKFRRARKCVTSLNLYARNSRVLGNA